MTLFEYIWAKSQEHQIVKKDTNKNITNMTSGDIETFQRKFFNKMNRQVTSSRNRADRMFKYIYRFYRWPEVLCI